MIEIRGLKKTFRLAGRDALPILSVPEWSVARGERLALLGPSGCGKSTLLHLIGGILTADEGTLEVAGELLTGMKETTRDAFRAARIGYVFQDFHLIPSLTAGQNVELALSTPLTHKEGRETPKERDGRIGEWFARVGLAERMDHLPAQLSRGEQQRVAIIRALVNRPPLVLADEPTGSLDRETGQAVMRLLVELSGEAGATLIAVTHDQELSRLFPASVQMQEINAQMQRRGRNDLTDHGRYVEMDEARGAAVR